MIKFQLHFSDPQMLCNRAFEQKISDRIKYPVYTQPPPCGLPLTVHCNMNSHKTNVLSINLNVQNPLGHRCLIQIMALNYRGLRNLIFALGWGVGWGYAILNVTKCNLGKVKVNAMPVSGHLLLRLRGDL